MALNQVATVRATLWCKGCSCAPGLTLMRDGVPTCVECGTPWFVAGSGSDEEAA